MLQSIKPRHLLPLTLSFSLIYSELYAQTASPEKYVQGSWVNIRQSEQAQSPVIHRLTANTRVKLIRQIDKSCEISWQNSTPGSPDSSGFIACNLLDDKALDWQRLYASSLNGKVNPDYSPARLFWLAPSMQSLFNAGKFFQQSLLNPKQVQHENGENPETNQSPAAVKLVRYKVPEFEAMKQVLSDGVIASPLLFPLPWSCEQVQQAMRKELGDYAKLDEGKIQSWLDNKRYNELPSAAGIHDCRIKLLPKQSLPAVTPSLFKQLNEIAPGDSSAELLSARFAISERGKTIAGPSWVRDYDIYRYSGAWDIGRFQLQLDKPVFEHVIGRTGLVGVYRWQVTQDIVPFGASQNCSEGIKAARRGKELLAGYPQIKDGLIWFQAPMALPIKSAKVNSTVIKYKIPDVEGFPQQQTQKLVSYEIDLNADGVADFVQWDIWGSPQISGPDPLLVLRQIFVNVNGVWYPYASDRYEECT